MRTVNAKNKFVLVHMLDFVRPGFTFERTAWPLHVTFLPWFTVDNQPELEQAITKTLKRVKPFSAKVNGEKMFGAKRDIPVNILVPGRKLQSLHERLLLTIESEGGELEGRRYVGDKFRPHVTHYMARRRKTGEVLNVDSIHLVKLIDPRHCEVIRRFKFNVK